jgi:aryl-alcohol dehydrogenase-like predicted oxidoreductase
MDMPIKITRRSFIAGSAACALGCVTSPPTNYSAYETVSLGKTGIVTSRLGFGTGVSSWNRSSALARKLGKEKAVKLIRTAYDRGVRFFDTADAYGTHEFVRDALKDVPRESYVITTKYTCRGGIPASDQKDVTTSLDRFLKELATDYIDIVQIHCVTDKDWDKKLSVHMEGLEEAKKKGKIRAHGCSFHSLAALETAAQTPWLDVAHVRINPYGRSMSAHPEKVMPVIKKMHAQGKGIIGMKILGVGSLAKEPGKMDASIAYSLNSGVVDVLNIGFMSINEVDDMARRIASIPRVTAL